MSNDVHGWVKMLRSDDAEELTALNPLAFSLAATVARRARWSEGFNRHGLAKGEALVGDHKRCGMTRQQYRTAKAQLEKGGFATFKSTNKGTIARLSDTRLFEVCTESSNQQSNQPANQQPTNGQPLTKKEKKDQDCKEGKRDASRSTSANSQEDWLASLKANPAYAGLDVDREFGKMTAWCQENKKKATRRRFVNWLNRCDQPVNGDLPQSRAQAAPTLAEVHALCREKWGNEPKHSNWAASFHGYWSDRKREWKRHGKAIDWKVELSEQVSRWRAAAPPQAEAWRNDPKDWRNSL